MGTFHQMSAQVDGAQSEDIFYTEYEVTSLSEFAENKVEDPQIKRALLRLPKILSKLRNIFTSIEQDSEATMIDTETTLNKFTKQSFYYKVRIRELEAENKQLRQRLSMINLPQKPPPVSTIHPTHHVILCDCPPGQPGCHRPERAY